MGLSFSSRARSLLCSCHSLVIVLGGAGAADTRPRQHINSNTHARGSDGKKRMRLTLAADAEEDGGGDADQADGAEEGAHALPRLHVRLARAVRAERDKVGCEARAKASACCAVGGARSGTAREGMARAGETGCTDVAACWTSSDVLHLHEESAAWMRQLRAHSPFSLSGPRLARQRSR
jgi:hypothetical protein